MDFLTTESSPIPITIDGTAYELPRFTCEDWEKREAEQRQATIKEACTAAKFNADQTARFITYFQVPPVDTLHLLQWALSPEGSRYVVKKQMLAAGVPKEMAEKISSKSPPSKIRTLAEQLTDAKENIATERAEVARTGDDAGPLAEPTGASVGSPSTENSTAANSPTSTAA